MPKKASTLKKKDFFKLDERGQAKELKKMAKRANVRLSLLEEKGQTNGVYTEVQKSLKKDGRANRKFYEGINYKSNNDIQSSFDKLNSFLSNNTSTLLGVQAQVKAKINNIIQNNGSVQMNDISHFTKQEQKYANRALAIIANGKLSKLEKADIENHAYKEAEFYNEGVGRDKNRFYRGIKFNSGDDLYNALQNEVHFLNSKVSTVEGATESDVKRINKFTEKGIKIPWGKEKEFYDFMSSKQFGDLSKFADSDQIAETYTDAREVGEDVKKINDAFSEFLKTNIDFSEVQERLKVAKWQKKLLH